jgi:hypothetical protein
VISGVGAIDKINAGRLALEGNNTFDGSIERCQGELR